MSELQSDKQDVAEKGVKRKKKRSSMQMAKKYARRSERGHGTELDSDTYQYMVRILEMSRQDFPSADERLVFANNVYEQTIGREIDYARNQVGSRVLDSLMDYAGYEVVQRLADALGESLRPICSDRFASHVVEKIIRVCAERGNVKTVSTSRDDKKNSALTSLDDKKTSSLTGLDDKKNSALTGIVNKKKSASSNLDDKINSVKTDGDEATKYNGIALKLCRYAINNMEEFVWDTYANHVLRTVIECLGGVLDKAKEPSKGGVYDYDNRRTMTKEYSDLLVDVGNRFLKWPLLAEFGKDELTSGLLQTLLRALRGVDSKLCASLIKRIIADCFTDNGDDRLSSIFHTESSVRLLEICLSVSKPKTHGKMYEKLFVGKLGELSLMSGANFAVQRLLDSCRDKEVLEKIFDELSESFVATLERRNTGVFASLANACARLRCKQGPFVNAMTKCLGIDESATAQLELVPVIAVLQNYEKFLEARKSETKPAINLHGSIVLQAMLSFNKPIKIVNSLLGMSGDELVWLLSDPKGSRILDAFMDGQFVGEKSREKLAKNLHGNWANLARGIHGSRCLDKIWAWAKTNQRNWIMTELASVGESLNSTKSGKIISAKLNVTLYARNPKDWSEAQDKQEKTRALFASIIGTGEKAIKESRKDDKIVDSCG